MVRYTEEHKQETRQRIIATAGRRLKRDGIDGSGVATLMKDAGLTNGAFYRHFESKDSLVAEAITDQLHTLHANIVEQAEPGRAGLEQIVRWYLSAEHRDNPVDGCPNAALLDEIARSHEATRQAYTEGVLVVIDGLAARMAPDDPPSARVKALSLLGLMAGTLQLSRALADRQLSDDLLEQGLRNALSLLDAEVGR
ncbi:TetR/AcrR family transcriptional regulator [Nocardioides sp. NPDC004968]|uniref:TetR/AcrR family transcriptional regulator n=1 Tax=Nocardioides sp. NPDC004968 TaxID=3155894 RepID=UPI0033AC4030